jgi:acyl-CoA thioesterase FadM
MGTGPPVRFVTASLRVDYLAPTPIDTELELRGRVKEVKEKKVVVEVSLTARSAVTARGEVVTVQVPPDWIDKLKAESSKLKA